MTNKKANIQTAQPSEVGAFERRIGHTVYRVGVYFNEKNAETARDKIIRIIKNETVGKGVKKSR